MLSPPQILLSDGTDLFWVDSSGGLWRDPIAGGDPTQLASGANWVAGFLFVDNASVYFLQAGGVTSVPKQGGSASILITPDSGNSMAAATVENGAIYFIEASNPPGPGSTCTIMTASVGAGAQAATTIDTYSCSTPPVAIAVAASTVYVEAPQLELIRNDAGSPTVLSISSGCGSFLGSDDGLYCGGGSAIELLVPSGAETSISSDANQAQSLAIYGPNIYWVNPVASGSIATTPKSGGATVTVAYDEIPIALAVDDSSVYWSDKAGNLQRAAKQW